MLRDILANSPDILAAVDLIDRVAPDILLLTGMDGDASNHAINAFAGLLSARDQTQRYVFASPGNRGRDRDIDRNGNGRLGEPADAQGYAAFVGQGGMAIVSRFPILVEDSHDFSDVLWFDLPDAQAQGASKDQRLSTTAHWDIAVDLLSNTAIRLWAWHATPPVFDGPEDRNGRRNADETRFWQLYLDRALPFQPADAPFVLFGDANLDPHDGDGHSAVMASLLSHPMLQDPMPRSDSPQSNDPGHAGDPALDTAIWGGQVGSLRVDYVLPSQHWQVLDAGIAWSDDDDIASRHGLVWVDLRLR